MTTRIVKIEKFLPATGAPVFQVIKEAEIDGQVIRLDPINPEPDELSDAQDTFAAEQQATINTLTARIAELEQQLSLEFDPRLIDPAAWYARLTMDNVLAITGLAASDPIVQSFVEALTAARQARKADPTYRMELDGDNAQNGIAYLVAQGALSEDDRTRLLSDALESEQ